MKQKLTLPHLEPATTPSTDTSQDKETPTPDEEKTTSSSLIESFKSGDESAFKILVENYQWRLYCSALKILKSKEDAEEAVAETFAIAFKERKKFKGKSTIYTYLWKICFNLCYHISAKTRAHPIFSLDESFSLEEEYYPHNDSNITITQPVSSKESTGETSHLFKEGKPRFLPVSPTATTYIPNHTTQQQHTLSTDILKQQVRQAIARLPKKYSRVIILRDFYNYSYEEIAQILSLPRGTIMSRLFRARKILKNHLKEIL